jgi:hypothetical protein
MGFWTFIFLIFILWFVLGCFKEPSNPPSFPELEKQIRELAKIAWSTEQAFRDPNFFLNAKAMAGITSSEHVIDIFLCHSRRIAPGLAVPHLVPPVHAEAMEEPEAGLFTVDPQGWVKISVHQDFVKDNCLAQAILAHEVCHYILGNSGIRKSETILNERYTDLCMFVLGLGEVFLTGYKRGADQPGYPPGHRIGYLTDAEYEFAQRYVTQLRQSCEAAPPSELEVLKQRLMQLTRDSEVEHWIIETARNRFPDRSELELYRYEIDRLEWERRRKFVGLKR